MIFGGIFDTLVLALAFTLGVKFHEKYPNAAHYCAFLWNAVELVAKGLYKLFGGTATAPKA